MRKSIKLEDIILDAGTQVRDGIRSDVVEDYSESFKAKSKFPPVDVFHDGGKYLLADGFHRVMGASKAGLTSLEAEVHRGTRLDCIKFALSANAHHGVRRTNADKRHAVEIALREFPKLSNVAIAEICAVSIEFVRSTRPPPQLATVASCAVVSDSDSTKVTEPEKRTGLDGKTRKLPVPQPRKPVPQPPHVDSSQTITAVEWFFGYGGNHIGLKRVLPQLRLIAACEIEAYAVANMVAKMEAGLLDAAPIWTDCKTFPIESFRGLVDFFIASYPCQGFSAAGQRKGQNDPRFLWPWVIRAVAVIQPRWVFFENVEGHVSLGLNTVISDLEAAGYCVAEGIFSAAECGAPQRRKRVFILGYNKSLRSAKDRGKKQWARWLSSSEREVDFQTGRSGRQRSQWPPAANGE
jgi:hypothetical protein